MDVVDAIAGSEAEDLVAGGLGSPPLPEGVQPGGGVGGGALDVVVELVGEVVVGPGCGGGHRPEQLPVEQVGADVVQRLLAGLARQRGEPVRQGRQVLDDRMAEGLVGQVQQLGGVLAGQHVDRHPEVGAAGAQVDLVVGVSLPPSAQWSTTRPASTP
jgi:hypothetical protein